MDKKFHSNFKKYINILKVVFIKNFKEEIRYPLNFISGLLFGIVWFLPTYFTIKSFVPDGRSPGLMAFIGVSNFYEFYMIGLIIAYIIMEIMWVMGFSLKRLMFIGVFETIWSYPIPKLWYIFSESIYSLVSSIFNIVILYFLYTLFFKFKISKFPLKAIWLFIPLIISSYGFGIILASLIIYIKRANTLIDTSNFIIQSLSGTNNPVQAFPKFLFFISMMLPWTYFLDLLRVLIMNSKSIISIRVEILIISIFTILIPVLAIYIFKYVDKKTRIIGVLHSH